MNPITLFKFFIAQARSACAMKRDEREYDEDLPDATRKARLEEEAATLLSLPKDVRKIIMIKLKPIDMYALYSGVKNYAFKKWCDDHFWDYALRTLVPDVRPPEHMVHPRWRFFAFALGIRASTGRVRTISFDKTMADGRDVRSDVMVYPGKALAVDFDRRDASLGFF